MMKRTVRNIFMVIVAAGLITAVSLHFRKSRETSFSLQDTGKLTRIELRTDTSRLLLEKKDGRWLVNRQFPVRKEAVKYMLHTLEKIEIKSAVSGKALQEVLDDTAAQTVQVRCYRHLLPVRSFRFILTTRNPWGNVMSKPGSKHYFTGYVPGDETLTGYPFTTNLYYWRSHEVFHFLPGEVQEVRLLYLQHPEKSFEAGTDTSGHWFFRLFQGDIPPDVSIDTSRIQRYLSYFQALSFDDFAWRIPAAKRVKIMQQPALYLLEIISDSGDTIRIRTIPRKPDTAPEGTGTPSFDPDITWAFIEPLHDLVILKYYRIDTFIKEPEYFYTRRK
ncbi:MAG: DUF4340 domain-containing protein [Chlorobi bacterium]|nr:DUF4340 domain-containing protein [Chlorobiota bacterium]